MKNKKVILLLISLTLLVGIVHPDTRAVFAEESAFTCDTESGFYAEANQPYIAPEVPTEEEPEEEADDALPQTGQNWAATALLALGGMFVTAAGWIRRKSEENA